ncbi:MULTISPECIES: type IV toxin-antitoxin system AbiEi family antitoxin domain-containing protein [Arthrobacter]|uniref:type IV toxin-antitoxin system AbiEi family antitoxin domain-containing protein n=1 Tax=unclassified Arthrobacter TaxID=235627 RepID=UPI0024B8EAB5|nr:type IV toxin-antitoxin system AbiEi family antitoxin domain-containing protein [Arthrobacter sp. H35-MC1]MDJ0316291.1 type IV toxin-antitoxin system AbiEi family antitoxin domain-containing protein [Arthrobacter sp. H35-MC1]
MNLPRLIRPADLEKVGQDRRALVTLTNKGELTRLRRGIYMKSTEWTELNLPQKYGMKTLAYQQQTLRQPVFTHATAGLLWGLWLVRTPQKLHVMTDVMTSGRSKNGVVRHRGSMTEGMLRCGPFLLTDKITTVMQLILSLDFPSAVAICDSSLRIPNRNYMLNHFTPAGSESDFTEPTWQSTDPQGPPLQLADLVNSAELLPTKAAQRRALAIINFSSSLSGSAGESISRAKMHQWGFPAPVLQKHFTLRDGSNAFVDFWFEEQKIVGEFDGKGKYLRGDWGGGLSIQQRVLKEKQRENQIRAQGNGFVRWDWKEMMNRERFIYLLREAGLRQK